MKLQKFDTRPFTSELMQLNSGPVLLSQFVLNNQLWIQGDVSQAGFRRFGIPLEFHQSPTWRGKKVEKGTIQLYHADTELEATSSPNCTNVSLLISEELLTKLGHILQLPLPWERLGKLESVNGHPVELARFHQTLEAVSHILTENPSALDTPGLRHEVEVEIPQQLLTVLSHAYPIKTRPLAQQRTRALKKALEYITDYAHEPPTVLEICRDVGVSKRTLEYAFLEYFGVSPKSYLQTYRFNEVHKMLKEGESTTTKVADVANRWGFWHMGQFAKDYRKLFGELPSETLGSSLFTMGPHA